MIAEKIADKIRGRKPLPRSTAKYYVAGDAPVKGKPMREVKPGNSVTAHKRPQSKPPTFPGWRFF
jgi:hypothetical protein